MGGRGGVGGRPREASDRRLTRGAQRRGRGHGRRAHVAGMSKHLGPVASDSQLNGSETSRRSGTIRRLSVRDG
jgi:hypothetical protein